MRVALLVGLALALALAQPAEVWAQTISGVRGTGNARHAALNAASNARSSLFYTRNWTPERIDRAERVSALANSGRCAEGVQLARDEDDIDMADALAVACEERFERADRLASVANAGQCGQAIVSARREDDGAMADTLGEICQRVQAARDSASPELLAAADAKPSTALDLRPTLVGEWAQQCVEDAERLVYRDDGTVRINNTRGRWTIENGLLVETFRTLRPGSLGDRGRLVQRSRISRDGPYSLIKQVVYSSRGAFPPEVILYRCDR